jgi:hypothetical protein
MVWPLTALDRPKPQAGWPPGCWATSGRQARIVETAAVTSPQTLRRTLSGEAIAVGADWLVPQLPPGVRGLPLDDLPSYPLGVGRRRDARRAATGVVQERHSR